MRAKLASSTPPSHGAVILADIPGRSSGFHPRRAQVYLPPAWFTSPRPHLPVIELLHGTPGGPADWTRAADADVTAERWAAKHDGVAPIIVMPDVNGAFWADTECVNGTAGNATPYLLELDPGTGQPIPGSAFTATANPDGPVWPCCRRPPSTASTWPGSSTTSAARPPTGWRP